MPRGVSAVWLDGAKGVLMNITCNSDLTMEEMTEASERIYNEVGDDADIIWGTVVDDTLEDEMRVTVIATGIGSGPDTSSSTKVTDHPLRGKVRDITPADIERGIDFDEPTFIRKKEATNDMELGGYHGTEGIIIDNSDLEVPTFLRRKAD